MSERDHIVNNFYRVNKNNIKQCDRPESKYTDHVSMCMQAFPIFY